MKCTNCDTTLLLKGGIYCHKCGFPRPFSTIGGEQITDVTRVSLGNIIHRPNSVDIRIPRYDFHKSMHSGQINPQIATITAILKATGTDYTISSDAVTTISITSSSTNYGYSITTWVDYDSHGVRIFNERNIFEIKFSHRGELTLSTTYPCKMGIARNGHIIAVIENQLPTPSDGLTYAILRNGHAIATWDGEFWKPKKGYQMIWLINNQPVPLATFQISPKVK